MSDGAPGVACGFALSWWRATDVNGPREKRVSMNILLWVRMKWLKLQQERIERERRRKNLIGLMQLRGPPTAT